MRLVFGKAANLSNIVAGRFCRKDRGGRFPSSTVFLTFRAPLPPLIGAVEEGDDLRSRAALIRTEQPAADAGRDAVRRRPRDRVLIVAALGHIAERLAALGQLAERAEEERHALRSRAGRARGEGRLARAGRDAVFNSPCDCLGIALRFVF